MLILIFMDNQTNIVIDILLLAVTVLSCIVILTGTKLNKERNGRMIIVVCANFFAVLFNMLGLIYKGTTVAGGYQWLCTFNFFEFFFVWGVSISFMYFILAFTKNKKYNWVYLFHLVGLLMLIINLFIGWIYSIDSHNVYQRAPTYYVYIIWSMVTILADFFVAFKNRKVMPTREFVLVSFFLLAPIIATIVQIFVYGVYILLILSTLFLATMNAYMLIDDYRIFAENQKELLDTRNRVMIAQVNPHFIYNCLSAIMAIDGNPKETKYALKSFSDYLRGNLDSLSSAEFISFETELKHINKYVELEKLRFGDKIEVEFQCEYIDFKIQPLTIQMLIENSIKHGISPKRSGGKVTLKTYVKDDHVYIEVSDNGLGFDLNEARKKDHYGLTIIEKRISNLHGTISVKSEPNKGCNTFICIPKEEK